MKKFEFGCTSTSEGSPLGVSLVTLYVITEHSNQYYKTWFQIDIYFNLLLMQPYYYRSENYFQFDHHKCECVLRKSTHASALVFYSKAKFDELLVSLYV